MLGPALFLGTPVVFWEVWGQKWLFKSSPRASGTSKGR